MEVKAGENRKKNGTPNKYAVFIFTVENKTNGSKIMAKTKGPMIVRNLKSYTLAKKMTGNSEDSKQTNLHMTAPTVFQGMVTQTDELTN